MKIPPHPGTVLRAELVRRLVKLRPIAGRLDVSAGYITMVTTGKRPIKAALAIVLEDIGIETAEHWLMLQMQYDLAQCRAGNQPLQL